jgi:hypothetical protein
MQRCDLMGKVKRKQISQGRQGFCSGGGGAQAGAADCAPPEQVRSSQYSPADVRWVLARTMTIVCSA